MQMRLPRASALAGAMAATFFSACKEPPFSPRWDVPMYLPLSTQSIALGDFVPAAPFNVIRPDSSARDSFPAQVQAISGVLGDLLKNVVSDPSRCAAAALPGQACDLMTLSLTKTTAVSVTDTLFVASSLSGLNAATVGTIVFPVSATSSPGTTTDSLSLSQASLQMLLAAGQTGTPLYVLLRGRVTNPGASPVTITAADSIGVSLSGSLLVSVTHK
jgi:hypothetical protein